MTTWQEALDGAFARGGVNNAGSVWVYNAPFREGQTHTSSSAGSIEMDGGGQFAVTNASTATEATGLIEDEVDDALTELGVADSDWSSTIL